MPTLLKSQGGAGSYSGIQGYFVRYVALDEAFELGDGTADWRRSQIVRSTELDSTPPFPTTRRKLNEDPNHRRDRRAHTRRCRRIRARHLRARRRRPRRRGRRVVDVYIVRRTIPREHPVSTVEEFVRGRHAFPNAISLKDAVTDLEDLDGLVADADILPGEQLLAGSIHRPAELAAQRRRTCSRRDAARILHAPGGPRRRRSRSRPETRSDWSERSTRLRPGGGGRRQPDHAVRLPRCAGDEVQGVARRS